VLSATAVGADEETDALARFDPSSQSGQLSSRARDDLRARAIDQIEARPLTGVGFQEIKVAHTIYLQLLASGGPLAFCAFVAFVGGALAAALRPLRRRSLPGGERRLVLALGISLSGWLAAGLASNVLIDGYPYVPVALLLAIGLAHRPEQASDHRGEPAHEGAPKTGGAAA
jgi:O-antigen ligase